MSLELLKRRVTSLAFCNLVIVAVIGVVIRSYPLVSISFPSYKNLLHAHSHFAFGGWVLPVLFVLVLKYFPEVETGIAVKHLRNIAGLMLVSAYGMLLSFPFQGYAAVSISFSTLSILSTFYMTVVFWQASSTKNSVSSILFLRTGLVFLILSSAGPFATAPLIAMGKSGSALYFNAIYFYLHFQYNGWFTFAVLAVLYKMLERNNARVNSRLVFYLNAVACIPAYFLSTLWSHPPVIFYIAAMAGAVIQVIALFLLLSDLRQIKWEKKFIRHIYQVSVIAFALKIILQLMSSFPGIADLAYAHRNFVIAYLHLVLLGFISAFALAAMLNGNELKVKAVLRFGVILFFISFLLTEMLLVLEAAGLSTGFAGFSYPHLVFIFSLFFPIGAFLIWRYFAGTIDPFF